MVSLPTDVETKAGHPPAVKAGGMRVSRPRQLSTGESKEKNDMTKEEIEEYGVNPSKESKEALVSGVRISEEKAFPADALRQYHMKPLPSHEMRPAVKRHTINQPK